MHYEINVALNGQHLFATHGRSVTTKEQAKVVYDLLVERFPISDGYSISVTMETTVGRYVTFD